MIQEHYRTLRATLKVLAVLTGVFTIYLSFTIFSIPWYRSVWGVSSLLALLVHLVIPVIVFGAIWITIERFVRPQFERNLEKKKREIQRLKQKLDIRLQKASNTGLPEAAFAILSVQGKDGTFHGTSKSRPYAIEMMGTNRLTIQLEGKTVLECEEDRRGNEGFSPEVLTLFADGSRDYEIVQTKSRSHLNGFAVLDYLPGDWEEDVLELAKEALKEFEQKKLKTIDAEINYLRNRLSE